MTTNKVVMILLFTLFASCSAIKGSAAIATAAPSIVMTERGPIRGTIGSRHLMQPNSAVTVPRTRHSSGWQAPRKTVSS